MEILEKPTIGLVATFTCLMIAAAGTTTATGTENAVSLPTATSTPQASTFTIDPGFWPPPPPTFPLTLSPGLNLVSYDTAPGAGLKAYDFIRILGESSEIESIQRFDSVTGSYQTVEYDASGAPQGENFDITGNEGYLVYVKSPKSASLEYNRGCAALELSTGLNLAAIPCPPRGLTAHGLMDSLEDKTAISAIQRLDSTTGRFQSASLVEDQPAGIDFPIRANEGYLFHMRKDVPEFQP
ncbi:MAG: hypothetical protein GY703_20780 [Gammaproteobacteria bacterium]|nr:hypothetical protein [Gammaproteobacteria bacterium]